MFLHMTSCSLSYAIAFFAYITLVGFLMSMIASSVLHILISDNETLFTIFTIVLVVLHVHTTLVRIEALIISKCFVAERTLRFRILSFNLTTVGLFTSCFFLLRLHCLIYICCSVVRCK